MKIFLVVVNLILASAASTLSLKFSDGTIEVPTNKWSPTTFNSSKTEYTVDGSVECFADFSYQLMNQSENHLFGLSAPILICILKIGSALEVSANMLAWVIPALGVYWTSANNSLTDEEQEFILNFGDSQILLHEFAQLAIDNVSEIQFPRFRKTLFSKFESSEVLSEILNILVQTIQPQDNHSFVETLFDRFLPFIDAFGEINHQLLDEIYSHIANEDLVSSEGNGFSDVWNAKYLTFSTPITRRLTLMETIKHSSLSIWVARNIVLNADDVADFIVSCDDEDVLRELVISMNDLLILSVVKILKPKLDSRTSSNLAKFALLAMEKYSLQFKQSWGSYETVLNGFRSIEFHLKDIQ